MDGTLAAVPITASGVPFRVGACLEADAFADMRRHMLLHCCKWDPQVGDVATLADFPLLITPRIWQELSHLAEALAAETARAEIELLSRPDLYGRLAIPRWLQRVLRDSETPSAARVIRFDFHWTTAGWRISEANSDVPGGYTEASSFTRAMAAHYPGTRTAGDPAEALVEAIGEHVSPGTCAALLAAPGYMEDQQVVAYLGQRLWTEGIPAHTSAPAQIEWHNRCATLKAPRQARVAAIVRFYQAEWLCGLPRDCGWRLLLAGGKTPVTNPAAAIFAESKRFPLVWDELSMRLPTWRRLLPGTRDPRDAPWRGDDSWILKTAFCNTGDAVMTRGVTPSRRWRRATWEATLRPGRWIAQRRFEPVRIDTPLGAAFPCIGVYVVNGRTAGIYGRITTKHFIDYAAVDVAVLVENKAGQFA